MSLSLIESLVADWKDENVFEAVEAALAEIGFDDAYVDSLCDAPQQAGHTKVIKDGIWGMVEVRPPILRLLDCPILQRLRTIHQLGFSYLTYPSAEHSRFAHSLGMFHVVSQFLLQIRRRSKEGGAIDAPYEDWVPDETQVLLAEIAAIMHDTGHMPFSHVTEQIMHGHSKQFTCGSLSVDDFVFPAEQHLNKERLAELLSVAIVLTPRFRRFLKGYVEPLLPKDAPERIAALILGIAAEKSHRGLANLISGSSIDADKIDYINRDAAGCGIAVGVDVSRLFLRSRFLSVSQGELQRLNSSPTSPAERQVIFVVNASGLDSIEEIGQARTMLYHRVYLHQTTRNAERLLAMALQEALKEGESDITDALKLWVLDDFGLLRRLADSKNAKVAALARRVRNRQLPKRAGSFGRRFTRLSVPVDSIFPSMPPKQARDLTKQIVGSGLEVLRSKSLFGQSQMELEAKIAMEAARLASLLHGAGMTAPEGTPLISVLPMPSVDQKRDDTIILDNENLSLTSSSSVSDEQMEAADIMKSTGYVLCDEEWRHIVFLASRRVFYELSSEEHRIGIEPYPSDAIEVTAQSRLILDENLVAQRVRLTQSESDAAFADAQRVGYFDDHPRLVPLSQSPDELANAAASLRYYVGQGNWVVNERTVAAFLLQFPPAMRTEVLEMIKSFGTLTRDELAIGIRHGFDQIDLKGSAGLVTALSPDSGSNVRTVVEQELTSRMPAGWGIKKSIRDAIEAAAPGDTLVLCDDNITSGSQASAQLLAWIGIPRAKWPKALQAEKGIETTNLSDLHLKTLVELNVWIVVAVGEPGAEDFVRKTLLAAGFVAFRGVKFKDRMSVGGRVGPTAALEDFLKAVGTGALAWCRHGKQRPQDLKPAELRSCEKDALGYSGARGLSCTTLNVPVGTYTAFWAPGFVNGEPWMPLLIRRGYLQHLVLS